MASKLKVEVKKDGKNDVAIITLPLSKGTPSKSGKTLVVGSTRGNVETGVEYNGGELILGCNLYIRNEE